MSVTHEAAGRSVEPVLASWKVSEVLARYPRLLDVFVEASPNFRHLRNPLMRKVQARLVTVAQAAQVAGVSQTELVRALNRALGVSTPEPTEDAEAAGLASLDTSADDVDVAVELDVRPYQERGEEPFGAIMAAVKEIGPGQALRLRNTFEPLPLYDVLARRGFRHRARQLSPRDWEILFVRQGPDSAAADEQVGSQAAAPSDEEWDTPSEVVTIDVSELVPPEPMVKILGAAEQLGCGQTLLVHHVRRPVYLYPRLEELGFVHRTRELASGGVEILIRRGPGQAADAP